MNPITTPRHQLRAEKARRNREAPLAAFIVRNAEIDAALNRKNALFAGHAEGGKAWGRIASLIETAKVNGVEPFACLKATLEAIAEGHFHSQIDNLLPWNFKPSS